MSYTEHLLPFSSLLKRTLLNHRAEIKERVCILLWKYIVTLEHGTHLHMHFSTWIIRRLHWGIGIILVSILPCHAMPMFKRNLVIHPLSVVILPSIMLVIPESVSYITLLSSLLQNIFDHVSCRWWGIHHGPPSMSLFSYFSRTWERRGSFPKEGPSSFSFISLTKENSFVVSCLEVWND